VGHELPGIDSLGDLRGRRVLLRADLNVPLADGRIADDGRVRASLPTIARLTSAGARVLVCSHLGRPKGSPDPRYSLAPVAVRLAELLDRSVPMATDVVGESASSVAAGLPAGGVGLLENLRFEPGETADDEEFARRLAMLADVYVDDAFGAVHRAHASVSAVARLLPHAAGDLVRREVAVLDRLVEQPDRPYAVVLGGAKVSDKLPVVAALLGRADRLLIGGGMCFTFLAAQGFAVGRSLLEEDQVAACRDVLAAADAGQVRLRLPVDVAVAATTDDDRASVVPVDRIPADQAGFDIGPQTAALFAQELADARTVFWNGPMGVFEHEPFQAGTRAVAEAVARTRGLSVVGGGDSAAAVRALGIPENSFTHVSTGGGASLEFIEGRTLPGLAVLEER
jgi:phosphoglycerate kinase